MGAAVCTCTMWSTPVNDSAALPAAKARRELRRSHRQEQSPPATLSSAGRWATARLTKSLSRPMESSMACVSQDGFLRVFSFDATELRGTMKSYFGGLLCVCWSPDGRFIVTGGEDDLVTVWSFSDGRVVARGRGHKSWVSVVAFDHLHH